MGSQTYAKTIDDLAQLRESSRPIIRLKMKPGLAVASEDHSTVEAAVNRLKREVIEDRDDRTLMTLEMYLNEAKDFHDDAELQFGRAKESHEEANRGLAGV